MMSSEIPSAKYSCSGSPLMLVNGNTAIEGLSGSARPHAPGRQDERHKPAPGDVFELLLTHIADFRVILPLICWYALSERQIVPGRASVSTRAAMLTPSP